MMEQLRPAPRQSAHCVAPGIVRAFALAAALATLAACRPAVNMDSSTINAGTSAMTTATSLGTLDIKPGSGVAIIKGQTAVVHYTGWLFDVAAKENKGKKFDSSRDSGQPFSFRVGAREVIQGWDQGVAGMLVGEQRRLIVPPNLGYGDRGAGGVIPGGATLVFDVELLAIK